MPKNNNSGTGSSGSPNKGSGSPGSARDSQTNGKPTNINPPGKHENFSKDVPPASFKPTRPKE